MNAPRSGCPSNLTLEAQGASDAGRLPSLQEVGPNNPDHLCPQATRSEAREYERNLGQSRRATTSRARRSPYAKRLEKQVTIRLDQETIEYFKALSAETQIPYQTLRSNTFTPCYSFTLATSPDRTTSRRSPRRPHRCMRRSKGRCRARKVTKLGYSIC